MESEIIVTIVVTLVASSGFWAFISSIIVNRAKKKSSYSKAILALLHDRLYFLLEKYIERGWVTPDEHENIVYLYEPYLEMHGNGTCKRLFSEFNELPIKHGEEG